MDEYGCMQITKEDAIEIKLLLEGCSPVVFALGIEDMGAMIIILVSKFTKMGTFPFGGNPTNRIYVGIYGKGCNHLGRESLHPDYIAEKLTLTQSDAKAFARFWDLMWL
jgi:hypothetical protein